MVARKMTSCTLPSASRTPGTKSGEASQPRASSGVSSVKSRLMPRVLTASVVSTVSCRLTPERMTSYARVVTATAMAFLSDRRGGGVGQGQLVGRGLIELFPDDLEPVPAGGLGPETRRSVVRRHTSGV